MLNRLVILWTFILGSLGVISPAVAQAQLETYTSPDGTVSLQYPHGWVPTQYRDSLLLTTSPIPADPNRTFQPGEGAFSLNVFRRGDQSNLDTYLIGDTVVFKMRAYVAITTHAQHNAGTLGDVSAIMIANHPAAFATGTLTTSGNDLEEILIDLENSGGYGVVTIITAPGDLARLEPKMRSIAASIAYKPLPPAGTPVNLSALLPITVHNTTLLKPLFTINAHSSLINTLAISPDNQTIASGGLDGGLRLWDASTGEQKPSPHTMDTAIWHVLFTLDGQHVVSGGTYGAVRLWDAATGEQQAITRHDGAIFNMAVSPDSQKVAYILFDNRRDAVAEYSLWLWDLAANKDQLVENAPGGSFISDVTFNPDGQQLLYTMATDNKFVVQVYDAVNHHAISHWSGNGSPIAVFFVSDSTLYVTKTAPGQNDIMLWNPTTNTVDATMHGHEGSPYRTVLNATGTILGSISLDKTARLWDAHTGDALAVIPSSFDPSDIAFSADGRLLVTSDKNGKLYVWGITTEA